MTAAELKAYIAGQLVAPVNTVVKVVNSFNQVVDFITTQVANTMPLWTSGATFQTDGDDNGKYAKYEDSSGNLRLFETKTDDNIGNAPPSDPMVTENTHWIEVSPSASAAIPEWAAGVYGDGLVIVYHNHSVDGRGLYVLLDPVRPFSSVNIETEITAVKWECITQVSTIDGGTP